MPPRAKLLILVAPAILALACSRPSASSAANSAGGASQRDVPIISSWKRQIESPGFKNKDEYQKAVNLMDDLVHACSRQELDRQMAVYLQSPHPSDHASEFFMDSTLRRYMRERDRGALVRVLLCEFPANLGSGSIEETLAWEEEFQRGFGLDILFEVSEATHSPEVRRKVAEAVMDAQDKRQPQEWTAHQQRQCVRDYVMWYRSHRAELQRNDNYPGFCKPDFGGDRRLFIPRAAAPSSPTTGQAPE